MPGTKKPTYFKTCSCPDACNQPNRSAKRQAHQQPKQDAPITAFLTQLRTHLGLKKALPCRRAARQSRPSHGSPSLAVDAAHKELNEVPLDTLPVRTRVNGRQLPEEVARGQSGDRHTMSLCCRLRYTPDQQRRRYDRDPLVERACGSASHWLNH